MSERVNISEDMNLFIKICKLEQSELKAWLVNRYSRKEFGFDIIDEDGFLHFIPQEKDKEIPVCLTAHMDTVHEKCVKKVRIEKHKDQTIISSPQGIGGDDRCGIYMALKILEKVDCSVLFCEDEEVGSIGAGKFVKTDLCESLKGKFKYIIELDRANDHDAVFYEDDNKDFHEFVTKEFWKETWGSWSDICKLSPALEISSVNLSCGYYKAHTTSEFVVLDEMEKSIEETVKLLNRTDVNAEPFKFIKQVYKYVGAYSNRNSRLWDYEDYYGGSYYRYGYNSKKIENNELEEDDDDEMILEVMLTTGEELMITGKTTDECWKNFFFENTTICAEEICDYWFI